MTKTLKVVRRAPLSKILRYGDPELNVTPTATVHEPEEHVGFTSNPQPVRSPAERSRYAKSEEEGTVEDLDLSEPQRIAMIVVQEIMSMPWVRWAQQKMQEESNASSANPVDESPAVAPPVAPAPQPAAPPAAKAPAPTAPGVAPERIKHSKASTATPIISPVVREQYSRLCSTAKNERLDYSKRQAALAEATQLFREHSPASADVVKKAIKRASLTGCSFEQALFAEAGHAETSLPLPPAHVQVRTGAA